MHEDFQRAFFPPALRVLGCTLSDFTLWHLAALQAIESPFLAAEEETPVALPDLQVAIRVCQHAPLTTLCLTPRLGDAFRRWRYARRWRLHAAHFAHWLKLCRILPQMWIEEATHGEEERQITGPLILSKIAALMEIGFTHREAWSLSPGYADWLILGHAERHNGKVKFFTDDDRAELEEGEQEEADNPMTPEEEEALARRLLTPENLATWLAARS